MPVAARATSSQPGSAPIRGGPRPSRGEIIVEFGIFIQGYNPGFRREGNPNAELMFVGEAPGADGSGDGAGVLVSSMLTPSSAPRPSAGPRRAP